MIYDLDISVDDLAEKARYYIKWRHIKMGQIARQQELITAVISRYDMISGYDLEVGKKSETSSLEFIGKVDDAYMLYILRGHDAGSFCIFSARAVMLINYNNRIILRDILVVDFNLSEADQTMMALA